MHNETPNIILTCFSWISAIIATAFLNVSPLWDIAIRLAPWASTFILYLTNFDKVNKTVTRGYWFLKSLLKK